MTNYIIILCNTNTKDSAETIATYLIKENLAACVNIIPKITSVYKWENKIEKEEEFLMLIKTKKELFNNVKEKIKILHPYDVPEIISTEISNGNKDYLNWLDNNTI